MNTLHILLWVITLEALALLFVGWFGVRQHRELEALRDNFNYMKKNCDGWRERASKCEKLHGTAHLGITSGNGSES